MDLGQIYTPKKIVKLILNEVGYNNEIQTSKILEPSCGDGNFLIEIVKRIIRHTDRKIIKETLNNNIYAWDIDKQNIIDCKNRLNSFLNRIGIESIKWDNIKCLNSIDKKNINLHKNKFDFIVGNPPYILYRNLDDKNKKLLMEWDWNKKVLNNNIFVTFIELSFYCLKKTGEIGMIVPRTMLSQQYKKMKFHFLKSKNISKIIDFRNKQIFKNVFITTLIFIANKKTNNFNIKEYYYDFYFDRKFIKLKDICNIYLLFSTLNNELFLYSKSRIKLGDYNIITYKDKEYKIEKELFIFNNNKNKPLYILYPYNDKHELLKINEVKKCYPFFYEFLCKNKIENYKYGSNNLKKWHSTNKKITTKCFVNINQNTYFKKNNDMDKNTYFIYPKNKLVDIDKIEIELNKKVVKDYIKKYAYLLNDINYVQFNIDLMQNIRLKYDKIKNNNLFIL